MNHVCRGEIRAVFGIDAYKRYERFPNYRAPEFTSNASEFHVTLWNLNYEQFLKEFTKEQKEFTKEEEKFLKDVTKEQKEFLKEEEKFLKEEEKFLKEEK